MFNFLKTGHKIYKYMCDNCCTPFIEGEGCSSALQKRASNVASGDYSVATGHGTIASNEGEMSAGTYNRPNDGQLFSVGVGTSDSNRMNAIQVNKDGSTSFLYNGQLVKLTELIHNVSPSNQIILDVQDGYIVVSYNGGASYTPLIALSELKGEPGITSVVAQIDSTTQELGVSASLSNGVLTLTFSGLQGGSGGGSNVAALNDLTDVTITSASNGQALIYRNGVWQNETIEGGGDTTPTDTGKVMYSSQATNPGNPDESPNYWHPVRTSYDVWMAFCFLVDGDWGDWTIIYIGDIDAPYASFKSFAFTRSVSQPSAPTGGSYTSPNPTTSGWSDGIPSGTGAIWMSSRLFASDNTHSDANWSTPRLLADNEFMDYEFSSVENPGTPSKATPSSAETNPNWSNEATESTIWMAMREISNGAYKAGSTWMVVKIKGEDGKDGTSVTIKGTLSDVSELPSTGNVTGDGYLINGNLYVWDGDSWENCGQIQGPPGVNGSTPYIHIKYSNDGGAHFTSNDGEDPGDYIGIYWDYTAEDSANVNSYTWKYWKGEDGFGYEYIFKLTTTNTAPNLPATSPNTDDYIPTSEGWTDDPGGVSSEYPYCWVAWRKKEDGVWSAWHGTTNGKARLYSYYGHDGTDGTNGIDGKDALPIRIRNWSEIGGVTLTGNDRVFSGYEDNAPFRDVIVITSDVYPSGITYPFTISDPLGTGSINTPVLVVVNYSDSYPNGFSGTNLSLPTSSTYTNSIASNKTESATLYGQGRVYSVFQNLGAVYARILVATQAYIGALTVDHLTTYNGNNSSIEIQNGLITIRDANGRVRIVIGQESGDSTPVLKFYDDDGTPSVLGTELYDLGPNGIMRLGEVVDMPEITYYRFRKFTSKPQVNASFDWQNDGTAVTLYKYKDGRRIVTIGSNAGVEYWNPSTNQYQSSHTAIDNQYISSLDAVLPVSDAGFYVVAPQLWETYSGTVEQAMLLDVRSGYDNFEGYIRVDCPDHAGVGTITAVYTRDEK